MRNLAKLFYYLFNSESEFGKVFQTYTRCSFANNVKVYSPCSLVDTNIGLGSYIGPYSSIQRTEIGKYCSIGPNFFCGYGQHPLNGLSTAPMFYSTLKQNGISLVDNSFFEEYQRITIGNDVFIGANVTILDGVVVGDGAVIGAGAVVTKNIPPYAIVVGVPARVIKYRFTKEQITELLKIKWWDWPIDKLKGVSGLFFDIDEFIAKHRVE